jgi:hypothetical protein
MLKSSLLAVLAVTTLVPLAAQQPMDPDFAAHVKEWTTKPEFSSPLVDHLPVSATVPSPRAILGYDIGAPKKLTYYADVVRYYQALAAASPRVKILNLGKTEEGRDSLMVFIGSEDSIAHLEDTKKNLARLADPRGLTDAQAAEIVKHTKPIYTLSGGLHSAELGPPEMLMELAYRLVTEDSDLIKKIRDNVIVSIFPAADPDGRDRNIDWYNRYLIDNTDEHAQIPAVPYWGKYTKHDDNRDINYAGLANQNLLKWYLAWHPPVIHDLHESVPYLYIFSGQAPQDPILDPILWGELPWFANYEMQRITGYGMPGVWTHAYVDGWSPGYVAFMSSNHNGLMRFYEIMGNGGATTMHRTLANPPAPELKAPGGPGYSKREWYRPLPPYKDVIWSMRNNTNYSETGVLTALELTSSMPQIVLNNFYLKSRNSIRSGETEAPYGFVLPSDQQDPTRVAFVIGQLRMQGIEVGRANSEIKVKDATYPAGSLVIKCNQPYGRLAKILLGKQVDPDPELMTYDDSAWTMSLMTHTKILPIADKSILEVATTSVDTYVPPSNLYVPAPTRVPHSSTGSSSMSGSTTFYAIPDHGSPNLITIRYALKDQDIQIAEASFKSGSTDLPAGTFLIPASAFDQLKASAIPLGLDAIPLTAKPSVAMHPAALPRVAMFSTWSGTQNVGWVRFAFDQYKIPYDLIYKEQLLAGDLHAKYDILLIPDQSRNAKALVTDIPKSKTPLAYTKTDKFKFLGDYGSSDDITGGMGAAGVAEIQKFVEAGGLLVTLGTSSTLPPDFGITPKIDITATTPRFYAPGPVVEAEITQPANPIFYGYDEKTIPVRWAGGPLFRLDADEDKSEVLMRFPGGERAVLSGLMNSPDELKRRAAILKAQVGKGEIVMFSTNPVWRHQNIGEYRMLFNTLLNYKNLDTPVPPSKPEN